MTVWYILAVLVVVLGIFGPRVTLTACSRRDDVTAGQLSPGDPIQQSMKEARDKFAAADSALSLARDRVQTLTGPDPYGPHGVKNAPVGSAGAVQLATDSGAPYTVGRLLAGRGYIAGVAVAFQLAIDSGNPEVAPAAAYNLGLLREEQGDQAGAAVAYQLAIDSRDADQAPKAAVNLGFLRAKNGDQAGAAAAYQLAIDSGHADAAPDGAVGLGALRAGSGDYA